jgi:hypothetical protein
VSRVRAVLGVELAIRAVFENPTVALLAGVLDGAAARPPLVPMRRPERLPLSFAQQRLWFLEQFHGPGTAYNLPFAWRLEGLLDAGALVAALGDVAGRHESLRTVLAVADGQPYQVVVPAGQAVVPVTVAAAGRGEVAALVAAAAHEFDLAAEDLHGQPHRPGPRQIPGPVAQAGGSILNAMSMSMIAAKWPLAATTASSCSSLPVTPPDVENVPARPPGLPRCLKVIPIEGRAEDRTQHAGSRTGTRPGAGRTAGPDRRGTRPARRRPSGRR